MKITNRDVENYLNCCYKAFLALKGKFGTPHDYEVLTNELAEEYRPEATEALLRRFKLNSAPKISSITLDDLKQGHALILDCTVETDQFHFHFDALKRIDGKSTLGSFHYTPVMFAHDDTLCARHRQILACAMFAVGKIQQHIPEVGLLVVGQKFGLSRIRLTTFKEKTQKLLRQLHQIIEGTAVPDVRLNRHCDVCEFHDRCMAEATEKDDLSLLRRMTDADIENHKSQGIFTLNQLSFTFRPRRRPKHLSDRPPPRYLSLQAQAIREQKVYVFNRPAVPQANTAVYFDMEGNSNATSVYLIGALIVTGESTAFRSFWADTSQDELAIFNQFFALVDTLNDPHLFHFGNYESKAIKRVLSSVKLKRAAQLAAKHSTNVLSLIYPNVYFPTFSNSLKDIGRHLGGCWSDESASGIQSVVWRTHWLKSRDNHWKDKLVKYNREDCTALQVVTAYISQISSGATVEPDETVAFVDTLRQKEDFGKWGERKFAIDDFRTIADCAYFEYQRNKVFFRTSPNVKKALRQKCKRKSLKPKPNAVIELSARKCWRCKGTDISPSPTRIHTKHQWDLRISLGGVRRWVTRYRTPFYRCNQCQSPMFPRSYKNKPRFGHNLVSWAMYQHVVNKMSFEAIELAFRECFSIRVDYPTIHGFKAKTAKKYKRTYNQLIRRLVSGSMIHTDETMIKLKHETGYVWVFASMEEVVYVYRPNREGQFLHEMLADFRGVLVSDFYAAYDSLECPQQKCLVHLMWDMNNDLFKHPFDEDLKDITTSFGSLMREIIASVDRFGLKSRYLRRHKKNVRRFFKQIEQTNASSKIAKYYCERLHKYGDRLFTFLDYNGVPWNNNNAEHAIKPFAKYRRLTSRMLQPNGLQDYLVLLSLWQSCEYRGISFLDFMLSKEKDIDAFCRKVW
jgi:predicted RecB family nuclease